MFEGTRTLPADPEIGPRDVDGGAIGLGELPSGRIDAGRFEVRAVLGGRGGAGAGKDGFGDDRGCGGGGAAARWIDGARCPGPRAEDGGD